MKKLALIATIFIMLAVLSMPLTALAAGGQLVTQTFQPSSTDPGGDSWTDEAAVTDTHGSDPTLFVQRKNNNARRTLVTFDISAIPSGSIISSATLSLWATANTSTVNHGAHLITASWTEAGVSWSNMPTYNTATTSVIPALGEVQWSVGTDISALRDGTAYGWMIISVNEASGNESTTYRSREDATALERPKLSVTYTAPWDSYEDDYSTSLEDYNSTTFGTIYMNGTGFADGSYDVTYSDAGAAFVGTDAGIAVSGDGILQSSLACNTDTGAAPGVWNAKVYLNATLIADDTFFVNQNVIPEFPTIFAAIGVVGLCFGIYWLMKRRLVYVKG